MCINNKPFVSIIIPCRNEEKFIGKCLDSIIAQDYLKDKLEVLVVDGMSDDGTRAIVEGYTDRYSFVKLVNNPKKITPSALNLGIRCAKGEVIVRMDAHAEYPQTYISTCIDYLDRTGADVVGGPVITLPGADTLIANSIALATSHPFGVGNSKFRTSKQNGYVDTVPFGAYRRDVFKEVGLFDECLVRNQDNELSSRIIDSGGKIYLTPELTAYYYNQSTISGLLKQALRTGMWNIVTIKIKPAAFRWRHFIPFLFVTALLVLGLFSMFYSPMQFTFIALVGLYGGAAVVGAIQIGLKRGMKYMWILPVVFLFYHVFYGLGTWLGVIKLGATLWKHDKPTSENVKESGNL
jgi:cellulose synthase/poly-beta-1,6-N-acetylglucosamine synthase-like glycosyltransferase